MDKYFGKWLIYLPLKNCLHDLFFIFFMAGEVESYYNYELSERLIVFITLKYCILKLFQWLGILRGYYILTN